MLQPQGGLLWAPSSCFLADLLVLLEPGWRAVGGEARRIRPLILLLDLRDNSQFLVDAVPAGPGNAAEP
jgi:hypothetical protein